MIALFVFFKKCLYNGKYIHVFRYDMTAESCLMCFQTSEITSWLYHIINCLNAAPSRPSWLRMWCRVAIRGNFTRKIYGMSRDKATRRNHRLCWNLTVWNFHRPFGVPFNDNAKARFQQFLTTYERFSRKRGREKERKDVRMWYVCWGFCGFGGNKWMNCRQQKKIQRCQNMFLLLFSLLTFIFRTWMASLNMHVQVPVWRSTRRISNNVYMSPHTH